MSQTEALFARYGSMYRWLATAAAMVSAIAVVLSSTIVNVAVPAIMGQFGIDQTRVQWLATGFLAAMTVTMLLSAWCERTFGQRQTMTVALGVFLFGSVLGGLAPDDTVLIVSRVIQGAAAGVIQPLAMVVMFQVFPPDKRGAAMGIFGIGVVLAPALGPWVGGLLMDSFDWRFLFYLGIPFGLGGITLAHLFLPDRDPAVAKARLDWPALVWLSVALLALLQTMSSGQRLGWASTPVLAGLAITMTCAAAFLVRERRIPHPLLDLRVFASPPFAAAAAVSFVLGAGLYGTTYLLPVFVQQIQNFTPTQAGLLLMPAGFVLVIVFPAAGMMSDRLSPGLLIGAGMAIFAYSSWLTAHVSADTAFWTLAWWTVIGRIGMGFVFPSLSSAALKVLPLELLSQGSGSMNFTRQLGGALGTGILGMIIERRTAFHGDALAATQTSDNSATSGYLMEAARTVHALGLGPLEQLPAAGWLLGQGVYYQAAAAAYRDGFLITAMVFAVALAPTFVLHRALGRVAARLGPGPQSAEKGEDEADAGPAADPVIEAKARAVRI